MRTNRSQRARMLYRANISLFLFPPPLAVRRGLPRVWPGGAGVRRRAAGPDPAPGGRRRGSGRGARAGATLTAPPPHPAPQVYAQFAFFLKDPIKNDVAYQVRGEGRGGGGAGESVRGPRAAARPPPPLPPPRPRRAPSPSSCLVCCARGWPSATTTRACEEGKRRAGGLPPALERLHSFRSARPVWRCAVLSRPHEPQRERGDSRPFAERVLASAGIPHASHTPTWRPPRAPLPAGAARSPPPTAARESGAAWTCLTRWEGGHCGCALGRGAPGAPRPGPTLEPHGGLIFGRAERPPARSPGSAPARAPQWQAAHRPCPPQVAPATAAALARLTGA